MRFEVLMAMKTALAEDEDTFLQNVGLYKVHMTL
jgi:hypothetical protein